MIRLDILRFTEQQYRQRRKVSLLLFLFCNLWLLAVLLYLQKPAVYLLCLLGSSVALGARLRKLLRERILLENLHNSRAIFGTALRARGQLDFEESFADDNTADRLSTERELAVIPRLMLAEDPEADFDASLRGPNADSTSLADVQPARERADLAALEGWEGEQESVRRLTGAGNQRRLMRVHEYNRSQPTSSAWWSSTSGGWIESWPRRTATLLA